MSILSKSITSGGSDCSGKSDGMSSSQNKKEVVSRLVDVSVNEAENVQKVDHASFEYKHGFPDTGYSGYVSGEATCGRRGFSLWLKMITMMPTVIIFILSAYVYMIMQLPYSIVVNV
ncbi:hypothetical protein LINGRAHAP2_LOCUS17598 [Linum grandiflorum]